MWAKILILSVLMIAVLVSSGYTITGGIVDKSGPVCNPPYIVKGSDCCLDQNRNNICDDDEQVKPANSTEDAEELVEKTIFIVSKVIDGDTVELGTGEKVRLLGINTPERGQPYYEESKKRLKELIEGKEVTLEKDITDKDQYGRLLRHVFLDNENVNTKLVREGLATVYTISPNVKYDKELGDAWSECLDEKINLCKPPEGEGNVCDKNCIGIPYFKWNAEGDDCYNLNGEYVVFKNSCYYSCDLKSWTVKDESSRDPYVFPDFILESGTMVTLYTGCGTNTNTQLYWCSSGYNCNAIWNNNGDTLYLRNSDGELVLSYPYLGY